MNPLNYQRRTYRCRVSTHLRQEIVRIQETDIAVYADVSVARCAKETIIKQRGYLESYIDRHPGFLRSLQPWPADTLAPPIVQAMILAGKRAAVGPMAAVAGAMAEQVGREALKVAKEIVVENGGDLFLHTTQDLTLAVFAGTSPLSMKVGLSIDAASMPMAVCTSSANVGHSLSLGRADAVCVLSSSCPLADAAATAIGNRVQSTANIQSAIRWGQTITGVKGILIIVDDKIGAWGDINLLPIS